MKKKTAAVSILLVLGIFAALITGCGKSNIDKTGRLTPRAGVKTIRFGYIASDQLHSPAVMVMKEKKLLEAAGFTVEWVEYIAGSFAMLDMAEGALDFACCGVVPVMSAQAKDKKAAIIAGANQEGASLVVTDSIRSISDLNNKKIATPGVGSIQDALLRKLAADNGIQIRNTTMKVVDMPQFLQKGEIDGFIAWAPHPAAAVEQKLGHELLAASQILPGYQCCVLTTTLKAMSDDPATVQKVLEIYVDAYRWFADNKSESIQMIAKATGVSEAVVREAIQTVNYPELPYCNVESMYSMALSLIENDGITTVKEADLDAFIQDLYKPELLEAITG